MEEDLKIALHWLASKVNKSHSSSPGYSHCPEVTEWCSVVSVIFCSVMYQINHTSATTLMRAPQRSASQAVTHFSCDISEVL